MWTPSFERLILSENINTAATLEQHLHNSPINQNQDGDLHPDIDLTCERSRA